MKLSKDKIIEAAKVFNQAKNFDEFKIMLDLCNVTLEDFERDYYEMTRIHPFFSNMISCGGKSKSFNSKAYIALDPKEVLRGVGPAITATRFKLPLWFEKDDFETISIVMPDTSKMSALFSSEMAADMEKFGIDATKELVQTLMYELACD